MSIEQEIRFVISPWTTDPITVRAILSIVQRAVEASQNGHQKKTKAVTPANQNK